MDFNHFAGDKSLFAGIESFKFLNNHQLESCILSHIKDFKVNPYDFKLTAKNLRIVNVSFFQNSTMRMKKQFFVNSIKVEESITFDSMNFCDGSNPAYYILRNSFETLQELEVKNCQFDYQSLMNFFSNLFLLENLIDFTLIDDHFHEFDLNALNKRFTLKRKQFGSSTDDIKENRKSVFCVSCHPSNFKLNLKPPNTKKEG